LSHLMTKKIKILVVDDHASFRQSLIAFLGEIPELEIIGEAKDGIEAGEMALALLPDIVLMDFKMPGRNGVEAARLIKSQYPSIKVILFSLYDNEVNKGCEPGAVDLFIPKQRLFEEVMDAIRGLLNCPCV
jgi:DNA-binding NarL/FixJ family response regulator